MPTMAEGATSKGSAAVGSPQTPVPTASRASADEDDFTPTMTDGRPSATSASSVVSKPPRQRRADDDETVTITDNAALQKAVSDASRPEQDEDFAPTLMEGEADKSDPGQRTTASKFAADYKQFVGSDDIAPTIVETPGGAGESAIAKPTQLSSDFEATLAEARSARQAGASRAGSASVATKASASHSSMSGSKIAQFLRRPLQPQGGDQAAHPSGDAANVQKYDIGAEIAKGGMGAILSARDINIRREVAMKVLLAGREITQNTIFRFIEEAQVTGQLEHPGIVPVYEFGLNPDGNVFYTMKFVKGVTLKDIIKKIRDGDQEIIAQYPLSRLLTVFQKVCDAMAFAHSKGIVHRDLKPENIMVGDFGEVLVMDWGLAKVLDEAQSHGISTVRLDLESGAAGAKVKTQSGTATAVPDEVDGSSSSKSITRQGIDSYFIDDDAESMKTMDGAIMGTPNFMAPEQASGHNDKIRQCSDIYALGGILYNLLTLRVPISGKSLTEMMVNIVRGNIQPPVEFNPASRYKKRKDAKPKDKAGGRVVEEKKIEFFHCPGGRIPEALSAVTMKALALKPEDRYPTVPALQKDIEAYQGGFATSAEEADMLKLMILMIKRHKAAFSILGVCFILVTTMGAGFITRLQEEKRIATKERDKAQLAQVQADGQRVKAENSKTEADRQRLQAENSRREAEQQRVQAEKARTAAEEEKEKAEQARKSAEEARKRVQEQKEEIQQTLDQLVEEKKRTEAERQAKEQATQARVEETKKREEVEKASAPEFVKKGQELAAQLDWPQAVEACAMAIKLDSSIGDAWLLRGRLHVGDLEFEEAVSAFAKVTNGSADTLTSVARKYYEIKFRQTGLSATDLRQLSQALKEMNDLVLSDRIYKVALEEDKKVLARFTTIRYDLKKANLELMDIHFQYTISDDAITLDLSNNKDLVNIKPLEGFPITHLDLSFTNVYELRHLIGMPLRVLHLPFGRMSSQNVFEGMPLEELHIHGKPEEDFSFITKFPKAKLHIHLYDWTDAADYSLEFLQHVAVSECRLYLHGRVFDDLEFFANVPLRQLVLVDSGITDLHPIRYLDIEYLDISRSQIKNFKTLAELPLKQLLLNDTAVSDKDLLYLKGKELEYLSLENTAVKEIEVLRGMPLRYLNISDTNVIDFNVLAGLPLKELHVNRLPVIELRFLEGMMLEALYAADTYVSDIRPLAPMPLKELDLGGTKVIDINLLERKPLSYLSIRDTLVASVRVVKGMPIKHLDIGNTPINDISALAEMGLNYLSIAKTEVNDISVLRKMPLKMLSLEQCKRLINIDAVKECVHLQRLVLPEHVVPIDFVKKHLTLEFLALSGDVAEITQTTTQFWSLYEARNKAVKR